MELSLNNIIEPTSFHAYVVTVVRLLWLLSNVCYLTYTFVYEIICMKLYESCWIHVVVLTYHFGLRTILLPACDVISFMCSFQDVYCYRLLRDTLLFPFCVLEPPCISLDSLQGHTLASNKVIILTFARYRGQGTTLLLTIGTPTPNCLRSS